MVISKKEFVKIVQEYMGIINSLCQIYFSTKQDQEDVRQDIILQLWRSIPNFQGKSKWSTWIYKVSLNTILAQTRREEKSLKWEDYHHFSGSKELTVEFVDDDLLALEQILAMLKPTDKALVILYLEGYTNKEIGDILNQSTTNITTRLSRIRIKLKALAKKMDHDIK